MKTIAQMFASPLQDLNKQPLLFVMKIIGQLHRKDVKSISLEKNRHDFFFKGQNF